MSIERTAEDTKQFHAFLERQATKPAQGHTPGPWEAQFICGGNYSIVPTKYAKHASSWTIASVHGQGNDEANARLIAAAPDLLAACKGALAFMDEQWPDMAFGIPAQLRAAITKAGRAE